MNGTNGTNGNGTSLVRLFAPDLAGLMPDNITLTHDAEEQSRSLAVRAQTVLGVTTAQEQAAAVAIARDIRTYVKQVKEFALEMRRPLNAVAAKIKEVEDTHLSSVVPEQQRLERQVADFQMAEARRVAAEEAKRREAEERLLRERLEAEEKAMKAAARMQTEAGLAKALEAEQRAKEAEAQLQAALRAPLPTVAKASGVAVKQVLRWEVVDINALVQARPDLCRIEAKASAIQATCVPERPVPGLRLWWETTASARTR
jgi:dTMP kinase